MYYLYTKAIARRTNADLERKRDLLQYGKNEEIYTPMVGDTYLIRIIRGKFGINTDGKD
jgi:hypothetical protein